MATDKFWMILGTGEPTYCHPTKASAYIEAERLARVNPNQEFVVLESLAVCKKTDISWELTRDDHDSDSDSCSNLIPF